MKIAPVSSPASAPPAAIPISTEVPAPPHEAASPDAPSAAPSDAEARVAAAMKGDALVGDIAAMAANPRVFRTDQQRAAAFALAQQVKAAGWDVHIEELPTRIGPVVNVVAELAGTAPKAERNLVIAGAHLDSVPRAPGGDDNASGSAAMLELAKVLVGEQRRNDIRIVWFDGEERGLFGSEAHVRNMPKADVDRTIAMVNADMIGAPHGVAGYSMGVGTTSGLGELIRTIADRNKITAEFRDERHSRSDHHSFDRAGIPSVDFGVSVRTVGSDDPNYHSPRDTATNIDPVKLEAQADLVALTVLDLAQRTARVPGPPPPRGIRIDDGPPI